MKNFIKTLLKLFNYKIKKINYLDEEIPIEAQAFEKKFIKISKKYSITDFNSLYVVTQALKYIKKNKVNGELVECGVWQGGNIILFKKLVDHYNLKKKIFGYDTFEGMTKATKNDINYKNIPAKELLIKNKKINNLDNIWCYSSLKTVKQNIIRNCNNSKNIFLIKGDVKKSLKIKKNLPKKISLLRLDTDFYDSTKLELEKLYPLLSKKGVLIIDDYGYWKGARKAVDEYFKNNKPWMHVINGTCRLIIKN